MAIILHIDMDAFFSAVEERERPGLYGKPVIVGADPKGGHGRGVVSTCNYAARKFGVRSGMPISRAYKLCPNGAYLPVNHELYSRVSEQIMEILSRYSPMLEQASIDEAFLDISFTADYLAAENLGREIKSAVKKEQKLTCSAGIGPNKLIAKIASDFNKPDGLTVVQPDYAVDFLKPLAVRKIVGIGPKTEEALKEIGVTTIGELQSLSQQRLNEMFGSYGNYLFYSARGIGEETLSPESEPKSISRASTFPEDTGEPQEIIEMIVNMSSEIKQELDAQYFQYKTVELKVRYSDFETFTRAKSLESHINDQKTMIETATSLLSEFLRHGKLFRLVGLKVSNLKHQADSTLDRWLK